MAYPRAAAMLPPTAAKQRMSEGDDSPPCHLPQPFVPAQLVVGSRYGTGALACFLASARPNFFTGSYT